MAVYSEMNLDDLKYEYRKLKARDDQFKQAAYHLDMTRGKPSPEQLDMISSLGFNDCLTAEDCHSASGSDCRNYGDLYGIQDARELFAHWLKVPADQVMVEGSSSLNLMYDTFVRALLFPLPGAKQSWAQQGTIKVLCPAPGYDRHFALAEKLGATLITVPMTDDGPDMAVVEELVQDPQVKAMFCVPLYSNPDAIIYSEATCRRLAAMETAGDFRIIWDNAYSKHHLDPAQPHFIPEVLSLAKAAGHPNRFIEFASTSKITYAGGGLAALAASPEDFAWIGSSLKFQTIGPDKMNQLRHVRFFAANGGVDAIMARHAAILKPKFDTVVNRMEEDLSHTGLAAWQKPYGGYFVGVHLQPGLASAVVAHCKALGVALTPAGATYPYGRDPEDSSVRISPSFPSVADLETAMTVFTNSVKLCAIEKILNQ
ncbi:aminotransferase class I/II-fold pyridoxal phosphate-dependent enzyme [Oscillospiraceae bacterium HV4-5-C5C]|nr:aminotransferase class I/II-fold pyridoxal phosphate-dependent enzyme [Oscillospiraceae bacterium HV4-5-C5C]